VHRSWSPPTRSLRPLLFVLCVLGIGRLLAGTPENTPSEPFRVGSESAPPWRGSLKRFPGPNAPQPLLLDDVPEPLPPERQRSEAQQDRVEALALFATGRTLEGRGWNARGRRREALLGRALRRYERALRYDPQSETVAKDLLRLALQLKRLDEAARVVLKMDHPTFLEPEVWMILGVHLMKKGDWQQAATMYEHVLAARQDAAKPTRRDLVLQVEMGRLYHLMGQFAKGADCFARVREALQTPEKFGLGEATRDRLLGEPGPTYLEMGECFLDSHRPDEAIAAFEKAHEVEPDQALLSYNLARVEAQAGRSAEALVRLETSFGQHLKSEGPEPYRLLSRLLKDLGKEDELLGRLEKLHAEDPDNRPLAVFLADAYRQRGRLEEAESLYRMLVEKAPTAAAYRSLAAIYGQSNRLDALLDVLGKAVDQGVPVDSLSTEGRPLAEDADLVAALIEAARKRLDRDPGQFGFALRLAVAGLALDAAQFEAARQFFELALEAKPAERSDLLLTWALGLLSQEQYSEAARVLEQGIRETLEPAQSATFHYYLAGALEIDGRTDEALAAARKAVELEKDRPDFLGRVAWVLAHSDRRHEAVRAYTELINRFDSDFGSGLVRQVVRDARLALSNLAVLNEDLPQAEEWLEQVLDEFPDDVSALNDLGYLWADQDVHLQRAHRMIRQAVEEDPDNPAYRDSLGWVLYRLGRHEEALAELQKAADADPDPIILDHLGDAYHAANQPDKAKDAWRKAVEAFEKRDENQDAKKVQAKIANLP
jgi:tetratricopeptide (TPR) repeat protein